MKIKIVTDSTSSFPPSLAKKEKIGLFESKVLLEGKDLKEITDIDQKELADRVPTLDPYPTTSVASPQEALDILEHADKENCDEILYIGVSPTISNQIPSVKSAFRKFKNKDKVTIHECGVSTSSQGALVHNALKLLKQGKSVKEIIKELDVMKTQTFTIGISPSFDILFKTGKVQKKASISLISKLLKLKPLYEIILDVGARGAGAGKGFKGAIKEAMKKFSEQISSDLEYDLIISDAFNTDYNEVIEQEARKIIKVKDVLSWRITPCVMLSTGVGSFQITLVPHIE